MPSKSSAQHRAMEVASHGKSTLGIPKKVAKEFVQADKGKSFSGRSSVVSKRAKNNKQRFKPDGVSHI